MSRLVLTGFSLFFQYYGTVWLLCTISLFMFRLKVLVHMPMIQVIWKAVPRIPKELNKFFYERGIC